MRHFRHDCFAVTRKSRSHCPGTERLGKPKLYRLSLSSPTCVLVLKNDPGVQRVFSGGPFRRGRGDARHANLEVVAG